MKDIKAPHLVDAELDILNLLGVEPMEDLKYRELPGGAVAGPPLTFTEMLFPRPGGWEPGRIRRA